MNGISGPGWHRRVAGESYSISTAKDADEAWSSPERPPPPGPHRPEDAGQPLGYRPDPEHQGRAAGDLDHRDHGPRHGRDGRRGDAAGAHDYLTKPIDLAPCGSRSATPSSTTASVGEPPAPRALDHRGRDLRDHRSGGGHPRRLRADPPGRRHRCHGPDPGGERHRQGTRRPGHSQPQPPPRTVPSSPSISGRCPKA